ncbi:MAG TPA: glycoside hydrolase family 44 protein, partial [Minicystis sp.]|nr:glycoside hydrolase family 44 protein [Minicystis sp.]
HVVTPGDPGKADVHFDFDSTKAHPISPYVYGTNQGDFTKEAKHLTLARVGGNRITAYNWETNASNAGSDYQYENDDYMSSSKVAGKPMKDAVQAASDAGASIIMTVPIAGWVAADEDGPCNAHPSGNAEIAQRFVPIVAKKGSAFSYPPDTTDGKVYADEFVAWLESAFPNAQTDASRRIFYMLDNEPDLWSSTHSEIHPDAVSYAELAQKNVAFAAAIKAVAPKAIVFGPVDYGWEGYVDLQMAPDANGRDWLEFWLDQMKAAEASHGARLVDVLDVHWYPEATGDGARITDDGTSPGEVEARLQAPRSLWDATYTETSWITQYSTNGPIALIPRLMKKIAAHYPGTKLSISEYNYGAGGDVSGGIAQADALGVFGREGLFAAANWLLSGNNDYLFAAFAMYRNYDGHGAAFGDTSIDATNDAVAKASDYASIDASSPTNVVAVVINKEATPLVAGIRITHTSALTKADAYTLTSAAAAPKAASALASVARNAFSYTMPPFSVTTLVFKP